MLRDTASEDGNVMELGILRTILRVPGSLRLCRFFSSSVIYQLQLEEGQDR
jgi:hypothetical protein